MSLLPLLTCNLASSWSQWVYAKDASDGARGGCSVARRWCDPVDAAATGSCTERWRFSAEEFISARRSALVELVLEAQKASWLGAEDIREASRVVQHLLWMVTCGKVFTQCLMIALSSKMCHRPSCSPSLPGASCLEVSGGNHWKSCGERAKLMSWDCVMLVRPLSVWRNGYCSCWTTWPWYWVLKGPRQYSKPQPHLSRGLCHLSCHVHHPLSAGGSRLKVSRPTSHLVQSVTVQEPHSDVDQCGTAASESIPDSELLTVLSAEAARVAREEARSQKLSQDCSYAGAGDLNKGRTHSYPKTTRRRRSCTKSSPNNNG